MDHKIIISKSAKTSIFYKVLDTFSGPVNESCADVACCLNIYGSIEGFVCLLVFLFWLHTASAIGLLFAKCKEIDRNDDRVMFFAV